MSIDWNWGIFLQQAPFGNTTYLCPACFGIRGGWGTTSRRIVCPCCDNHREGRISRPNQGRDILPSR
jgi:hypothetical protein